MKLLTKNTDYAIRALLFLAQRKEAYSSSREIAENNKIPLRFMRRILFVLTQNHFVDSKEGVKGGVRLKKSPKKVPLIEVISVFQGDIQVSECMFRKGICPNKKTCVLHKKLKKIEKVLIREFKALTLQSLLDDLPLPKA